MHQQNKFYFIQLKIFIINKTNIAVFLHFSTFVFHDFASTLYHRKMKLYEYFDFEFFILHAMRFSALMIQKFNPIQKSEVSYKHYEFYLRKKAS